MTLPPVPDLRTVQLDLVEAQIKTLLVRFEGSAISDKEFWEMQFDLGLAWVGFPLGFGGLGVSPSLQEHIGNRLREAEAPSNFLRNPIGIGMGAPTVLVHASADLAKRLLKPIFTCDEIWCQLFSEPGAGSDVASVRTSAVRDGDEWIINGQKVWTTLAHVSKWGMLLTRTDITVSKHAGMTYFILDMESPGVEIRPLRQMTGDAEFNEVYFTDVRIPDSHRLGNVGDGWATALTTLMNERVSLGGTTAERESGPIGDAVRIWKELNSRLPHDRDRLAQLWIEAEVSRLTNIRASQMRMAGTPGPEGSVGKLISAELNKKIYEFCINLLGPQAMTYASYEMKRPGSIKIEREDGSFDVSKAFLRSRANSIEGGTSEIMKNILGERVLGLPREPRSDHNIAFSQLAKS
ncbi:MAG: acyl-CoA dehydrogenase family protein [Actinomycetota bacterium]|nr:acyl-CoA dehydrogenase family protein [Actinomycetota bacterium]